MHDQIATDMIMTLKEEVANLNREINELAEEKNARIMELEEGLVNLATWTEDNCDKGVYCEQFLNELRIFRDDQTQT